MFTLLNDDRYVKQYMDEGFSAEDARSYIGVGCWNGFIDSVMDVDEANYTSVIRILEMTIHKNLQLEKEMRLTDGTMATGSRRASAQANTAAKRA